MTIKKGFINIPNITGNVIITAHATKVGTVPEVPDGTIYENPTVSFDTNTYRVNMSQDGYSETFYVSYARNESTPGYVGIKQFYDDNAYPYYLTLASEGTSRFRVNGNVPVDGWCSYEGGYDGNGYFLDLSTKAFIDGNLNMKYKIVGVPQKLVQEAMSHINNNAIGSAIKYEITTDSSAPYSIEMVNIEDEVLAYNYHQQGLIQINEWMCEDYYGAYDENDIGIFRRWMSTTVHELGHSLGFDDEAQHIPTIYNYYRDVEDDEAMIFLQANDWVFLETEFKNKLGVDLRTATSSTIPTAVSAVKARTVNEGVTKKVKFSRPRFNADKADIIVEGKLSYVETKELNVSKNPDQEVLIEYDIYDVEVNNLIKGDADSIRIKVPVNELLIDKDSIYKLYLRQYENTPCSLINLKEGIEKIN